MWSTVPITTLKATASDWSVSPWARRVRIARASSIVSFGADCLVWPARGGRGFYRSSISDPRSHPATGARSFRRTEASSPAGSRWLVPHSPISTQGRRPGCWPWDRLRRAAFLPPRSTSGFPQLASVTQRNSQRQDPRPSRGATRPTHPRCIFCRLGRQANMVL